MRRLEMTEQQWFDRTQRLEVLIGIFEALRYPIEHVGGGGQDVINLDMGCFAGLLKQGKNYAFNELGCEGIKVEHVDVEGDD